MYLCVCMFESSIYKHLSCRVRKKQTQTRRYAHRRFPGVSAQDQRLWGVKEAGWGRERS